MKYLFSLAICILLLPWGCGGSSDSSPPPGGESFSFENGMEGWTADGTDLEHVSGTIEWSIERTRDRAKTGNTSLRLYLNNLNDAGKIWIERPFDVEPNQRYRVNVTYAFGSSDWGDFNHFWIIAKAALQNPENRDDLAYQGDTANGSPTDVGYVWLEKSYDFNVQSGSDGVVYVCIGVWGPWEGHRTYYLDDVRIVITKL